MLVYTPTQNNVIDNTQYVYVITIVDENAGSAVAGNIYLGMDYTISTSTPPVDNVIELSIGYNIQDDPISPTFVKMPGSGMTVQPGAKAFPVNLTGFVQSTQEGSLYVQPAITADQAFTLGLFGNLTLTVNILRSTGIVGD